jgi:hypothetical protein
MQNIHVTLIFKAPSLQRGPNSSSHHEGATGNPRSNPGDGGRAPRSSPPPRPAKADCRSAACLLWTMVLSKQASSPRARAQRQAELAAEAGCRVAARRVQLRREGKGETSGRDNGRLKGRGERGEGGKGLAPGRSRLPGGGPQGADDGVIEA